MVKQAFPGMYLRRPQRLNMHPQIASCVLQPISLVTFLCDICTYTPPNHVPYTLFLTPNPTLRILPHLLPPQLPTLDRIPNYPRADDLAVGLVGDGDDGCFEDVRGGGEGVFDLDGEEVFAAADDDVLCKIEVCGGLEWRW